MTDVGPKKYAIVLSCGPDAPGSRTALSFCEAVLRRGHVLVRVFFQEQATLHFHTHRSIPQGAIDLAIDWGNFLHANGVEAVVCVSSAYRHGILNDTKAKSLGVHPTLTAPGIIGGLGAFAESIIEADHVLHFGKPGGRG